MLRLRGIAHAWRTGRSARLHFTCRAEAGRACSPAPEAVGCAACEPHGQPGRLSTRRHRPHPRRQQQPHPPAPRCPALSRRRSTSSAQLMICGGGCGWPGRAARSGARTRPRPGASASGRPAQLQACCSCAAACAPSAVLRRRSVMEGGPWSLSAGLGVSCQVVFDEAGACAAEAEGWGPRWTARSRPGIWHPYGTHVTRMLHAYGPVSAVPNVS